MRRNIRDDFARRVLLTRANEIPFSLRGMEHCKKVPAGEAQMTQEVSNDGRFNAATRTPDTR
jgi:hypothetical protein